MVSDEEIYWMSLTESNATSSRDSEITSVEEILENRVNDDDPSPSSPIMFTGMMKKVATDGILLQREELKNIADSIWTNPELGFEENHAHDILTDYLKSKGFHVQRNYFLPTAFRAEYSVPSEKEGVTVCILCEYDALSDIGHGCGHNLIAEAGVGAAVGVKRAMETFHNVGGKLVVMGTPGAEGGGGKIRLIKAGAFKDIDFSMMVHPDTADNMYLRSPATARARVTYFGRGAHAASPWNGINALDAAIACYNNVAIFRQQIRPMCSVSAIITKGGLKINVIPEHTELLVGLQAPSRKEIIALKKATVKCFEAAAVGTGCQCESHFIKHSGYNSLILNEPLLNIYRTAAKNYGVKFSLGDVPGGHQLRTGSATDMGNVSRLMPSIHPRFSIPTTGPKHTKEFATAAGSPVAQPATIRAACCLTITALKLMTDPYVQEMAQLAFSEEKTKRP